MASYFDEPDECDDGEFRVIRYNELLTPDHPARLIKQFVDGMDLSCFENRYKVGNGQKGRAPKGVKLMLGVILYAMYSRIYSGHKIEFATETYSDFWLFTHGKRISHDKICDFINKHGEEINKIFVETILLAKRNELLSFDGIYQDGFHIKANGSRRKNKNKKRLNNQETKLSEALTKVLERIQESEEPLAELKKEEKKIKSKMKRVAELRENLNKRIKNHSAQNKSQKEAEKVEEKLTINTTDEDSELMKMKDGSFDNAYLKVCATDSKADIVVASQVEGHYDEPGMLLDLFDRANENCSNDEKYSKVIADSGFVTMENSAKLEEKNAELIGPTKAYENETRNTHKQSVPIHFDYDEEKHCLKCTGGGDLQQIEKYFDKKKQATIYTFRNKEACRNCSLKVKCTTSKYGYRTVKIDSRLPAQNRTLERYKSEEGQALYKKRAHAGETYQGDLKQNGKFLRTSRRGVLKVRVESVLHDIAWNLRRIFNSTSGKVLWQT